VLRITWVEGTPLAVGITRRGYSCVLAGWGRPMGLQYSQLRRKMIIAGRKKCSVPIVVGGTGRVGCLMAQDGPGVIADVPHDHDRLVNVIQHDQEPLLLIGAKECQNWHITAVEAEAGADDALFSDSFEASGSNDVWWRLQNALTCKDRRREGTSDKTRDDSNDADRCELLESAHDLIRHHAAGSHGWQKRRGPSAGSAGCGASDVPVTALCARPSEFAESR
jgi:hypothetical protein